MSLIEVLVATAIVGVMVFALATMSSVAITTTRTNADRQFATQKAIAMLEELKSLVEVTEGATITVLDGFHDGSVLRDRLTTQGAISADPAEAASGNTRVGDTWLYARQINVSRLPSSNDVRLVRVRVYGRSADGTRLLAETASVLRTLAVTFPPTQVYDVYCVAVENVPGWWVNMSSVIPFVQNTIGEIQARNPGLQFRVHWIRKLSYGRDALYTPFVNETGTSTQAINRVYYYPGLLPATYTGADDSARSSPANFYYPPANLRARVATEGGLRNDHHATSNPFPYALADQFNNAMRFPDELTLYQLRAASGAYPGEEPTLRLLIEDMYRNPDNYRNAILINLHGELFPFPPIRNYSDPARRPDTMPGVRVVTHPERLATSNGDALRLRVHAWLHNPGVSGNEWLTTPITVRIRNVNWTPAGGTGSIAAVTGGVDFDGAGGRDTFSVVSPAPSTAGSGTRMYYTITPGTDTTIQLYNTPLKAPCLGTNCSRGGLAAGSRLYGMEYIPSPVENFAQATAQTPFATNLATTGTRVKNTARWIITIPSSSLSADSMITIDTRIGTDLTTGRVYPTRNEPPNESVTYAWRGTDTWLYGTSSTGGNLPLTERYQILGDPRHLPYADLKMPHSDGGAIFHSSNVNTRLGMGYNRYFDDFHDDEDGDRTAAWPGWSYTIGSESYGIRADGTDDNDRWGQLEIDEHRIFQTLRTSLMQTNAIYTTMTGFSYFYTGIGGEIGADSSNRFPDSIPVSRRPANGSDNRYFEQSITDASIDGNRGGVKYVQEGNGGWTGLTWLGELYPDARYDAPGVTTDWVGFGNLPTGNPAGAGPNTFRRVLRDSVAINDPANARHTPGTTLLNATRRPAEAGSTTFFWSGTASSTFHHLYRDGTTASLSAAGNQVAASYNFPLDSPIPASRPFNPRANDTGMNPVHFLQDVYGGALQADLVSARGTSVEYYRHDSANVPASGLLYLRDPRVASSVAFIVQNGLSPVGDSGTAFVARWSFLSLIESFLSAGLYDDGSVAPRRVVQVPRLRITAPDDTTDLSNVSSIRIAWDPSWLRWDGRPYTPQYRSDHIERSALHYVAMYSRDNGATWRYVQDDAVATPGRRLGSTDTHRLAATSVTWDVPATTFPEGSYIIRVEAHRSDLPLHYAFHQFRAFINRG